METHDNGTVDDNTGAVVAAKNWMTSSIGEYCHPKINAHQDGLKEEGLSLKLKG